MEENTRVMDDDFLAALNAAQAQTQFYAPPVPARPQAPQLSFLSAPTPKLAALTQPPTKMDLAARAAAILNNAVAAKAGGGVASMISAQKPAAPNLASIGAMAAAATLRLKAANLPAALPSVSSPFISAVPPVAAVAPLTGFHKRADGWPPMTYGVNGLKIMTAERVVGNVRHDILVQVGIQPLSALSPLFFPPGSRFGPRSDNKWLVCNAAFIFHLDLPIPFHRNPS